MIELAHDITGIPYPSGLIVYQTEQDGNSEIYARGYYDQNPTNLTNDLAEDHSFAWSPDGSLVAYALQGEFHGAMPPSSANSSLYDVEAGEMCCHTGLQNQAGFQNTKFSQISWSPPGLHILLAYIRPEESNFDIIAVLIEDHSRWVIYANRWTFAEFF